MSTLIPDQSEVEILQRDRLEFKRLASLYQAFGASAGVTLTPFRDATLPHFSALGEEARRSVLGDLARCVSICAATEAQGGSVSDSPALLWAALKELELRPPSDLFGYLDSRSIVEVHSDAGVQIFRTFNFYEYCSYSLDELYCVPWYSLFEREEEIALKMLSLATRIFTSEIKSTVSMELPPYVAKELYSPLKHEVRLEMKWIAPLFQKNGRPGATAVVERLSFVQPSKSMPVPERTSVPMESPRMRLADSL